MGNIMTVLQVFSLLFQSFLSSQLATQPHFQGSIISKQILNIRETFLRSKEFDIVDKILDSF